MYGYDAARTPRRRRLPPPAAVQAPLDASRRGDYIEFPPAVADNRVFVANQHGDFLAIRAKTGKVVVAEGLRKLHRRQPGGRARGIVVQAVMNPTPCAQGSRDVAAGLRRRDEREDGAAAVALQDRSDRVVAARRRQDSSTSDRGITRSTRSTSRTARSAGRTTRARRSTARPRTRTGSSTSARTTATSSRSTPGRARSAGARSSFSRFGRREYFYATPTVAYGRVYIGNTDGTLYAFGAKTRRPALGTARGDVRLLGRGRVAPSRLRRHLRRPLPRLRRGDRRSGLELGRRRARSTARRR